MALEIINKEIVGEIDDLDAKLSGEIPVTRLELLHLANSGIDIIILIQIIMKLKLNFLILKIKINTI